ncbi:MAG: glycosyl hydrolase [Armatimonadota bacterium]
MPTPDLLAGFITPPASCTQIPFWFLNGPVDGEEYCRQIDEMAAQNVQQAMPHPRYGMDRRDYLEPRYWDAFSKLVRHAAATGVTLHLYDEYNWSSGPAGGRVTTERAHCSLGLGMRARTVSGPAEVVFDEWTAGLWGWGQRERYLSALMAPAPRDGEIDLSQAIRLETPPDDVEQVRISVPAGEWEVMVFYTIRTIHPSPLQMGNGGVIDYLAPQPTARFIAYTHEEYFKHFGEQFGGVIPSIFVDEPGLLACGTHNWTDDFPRIFQEEKGYDILPLLPLLYYNGGRMSEKVRCDCWDLATRLLADNHIGQIADWCAAHGIALTGHTYEEPERWMIAGDCMRTLRRMQWPGLDSLGGYKEYHYHKPAAGVPHIAGKEALLCESLGLLGLWGASPRMIKEGNNQLAVVGVTHQVPHAFFQTIDSPKVECPPSFFDHNPYWKYYEQIATLTARQCWMNRQGSHVADIAVLYPVVSWFGDAAGGRGYSYPWDITTRNTEGSREDRLAFETVVNGLMGDQLDHDVVDSIALREAEFASGVMRVADEAYRVLILPPMHTARLADLRRAVEFAKQGGLVVVVGKWPNVTMEAGREDPELPPVLDELRSLAKFVEDPAAAPALVRALIDPDVEVLLGDPGTLEISHRRADGIDVYTVSHHAHAEQQVRLRLRAHGPAALWDPESGKTYRLPAQPAEGKTEVELFLGPQEAPYVVLGGETANLPELPPHHRGTPARVIPIDGPWQFLPVPKELDRQWSCTVGEQIVEVPVFRTRELSIQPRVQEEAALWTRWFLPDFDDSQWETVHCLRGPLLYSDAGSRLFRTVIPAGATAIQLPLPVEKEHVLYVNGERVLMVNGHNTQQPGWLELPTAGEPGVVALECSSMAPDFGLTGPLRFRCRPVERPLESWTRWGLWWYTGRALYTRKITVPECTGRLYLNLGEVRECAEIWVNGRLAGSRIWPPYRVDITDFVRPGENEVAVIASNLLSNRMAWDDWGTRGPGETLDSGVLGPVSLEIFS